MKIIILEQAFVLHVKVLYDVIIQTFFYSSRVRKTCRGSNSFIVAIDSNIKRSYDAFG